MKRILVLLLSVLAACSPECLTSPGVPYALARYRKTSVRDLQYRLFFDLTSDSVPSSAQVAVSLDGPSDIILDFTGTLRSVTANGTRLDPTVENGHIRIPSELTAHGENSVDIEFLAESASLNRRGDFLYTLLVPDRARTLFPCMDQPDLKARYMLTLKVPEGWTAVSNSPVFEESSDGSSRTVSFSETQPLSTYLFSFVAGRFEKVTSERNGRTVSMYHRETDPVRLCECPDIMDLVFSSLEYMEEYTGIPYPFSKYDFIVIPDFQYGGMEHAGATLYNDRRIFLGPDPTTEELLARQTVISHETAHMWFGDLVTMPWFDEVWTKEVMANWFAARMSRPSFPSVNHALSDLSGYYAPAYEEDRTAAANAILRPLDNLDKAGLIYCNTIYDKSPIVLEKLYRMVGEERFREGLSEYLSKYAYSNASWSDLVETVAPEYAEWSRAWINEPGMPVYSLDTVEGGFDVILEGTERRQNLSYRVVAPDGNFSDFTFDMDAARHFIPVSGDVLCVVPNSDGLGYGWFRIPSPEPLYGIWASLDATARMSLLMTLYENALRRTIPSEGFIRWMSEAMLSERENIIFGAMAGYLAKLAVRDGIPPECERRLLDFAVRTDDREKSLLALRTVSAVSECCDGRLLNIWRDDSLRLPENDLTRMSYELMVRFPDRYDSICSLQSARITNPDRLETFRFVSMAASPDSSVRDSMFASFTDPRNRRPESRVYSALQLLCHFRREEYSRKYVMPAMRLLPEVQRTGDIFFPAKWCKAVLSGRYDPAVAAAVRESAENMHPLLATKVLQQLP